MAKANTAQEPSMEEILASIRRIISDDTPPASPPAKAPAAPPPPADSDDGDRISEDDLDKLFSQDEDVLDLDDVDADEGGDVLDLTEEFAAGDDLGIVEGLMPDEAEVTFAMDEEPEPEPSFEEPEPEPAFEEPEPEPEPAPPPPPPRMKMPAFDPEPIAAEAERLVSNNTSQTVSAAFGTLNHTILTQNAKTLDDVVKELLRPMLKAWLDENLPVIVERLVRAEIERVTRGR